MNRNLVFAFLVAASVCLLVARADEAEVSVRKGVELPKLFDFAKFKDVFKRSYNSVVEELIRQKLFLARAFRAFMSHIKFTHKVSSYYLRINSNSDRTPAEIQANLIRVSPNNSSGKAEPETPPEPTPLASKDDIERELADAQSRASEDGFKEIADELKPSHSRRRRDAQLDRSPSRREVRLSDLEPIPDMDGAEFPEMEDKVRPIVPSNNPDRETPEYYSYGADLEREEKPLDPETLERLNEEAAMGDKKTKGSLAKLASKLANAVGGRNKKKSSVGAIHDDEVYIDHRDSKCFFRVRDQGECGSCYSFAFTSYLEYLNCKATGDLVAFSEQYAVDCGYRQDDDMDGCDGAFLVDAGDFFVNYGMELRATYPYVGQVNQCPYSAKASRSKMGYIKPNFFKHMIPTDDHDALVEILKQTPLVIGIGTNKSDFAEYGGGVHDMNGCRTDLADHAVLLIGHGREDGRDYWLIRNSHGTSFGEKGYYKLDKSVNCIFDDGVAFGSLNKKHFGMNPVINRFNDEDIVEEAGKKLAEYKKPKRGKVRKEKAIH